MAHHRRVLSAVLVAGVLVGVAACGSEPESSAALPEPGTSAQPAVTAPATPLAQDTSTPKATPPIERAAEPTRTATPTPSPTGDAGTAAALLATLPVKGRSALTGYEREAYGQAWADVDRNGCDTRNDVLRRDLSELEIRPGTNGCVVLAGALTPDPYTGSRIDFARGGASEVDIDHVVALADSWVSGAARWDERKRIAFGNDPLNLLAVDASANRQKGAGDAATWLPRADHRCVYVARQIAVKTKYELAVKPAERDAMTRVLAGCPGQDAPEFGPVVLPAPGLGSAPRSTPAPTSPSGGAESQPRPAPGGTDPQFPYCTDAIAAGYGPYVRGQDAEYGWYRDADSDGVVCE